MAPRRRVETSNYTFQGLGENGWEIMAEIREAFGVKIVTEAVDESNIDLPLIHTVRHVGYTIDSREHR